MNIMSNQRSLLRCSQSFSPYIGVIVLGTLPRELTALRDGCSEVQGLRGESPLKHQYSSRHITVCTPVLTSEIGQEIGLVSLSKNTHTHARMHAHIRENSRTNVVRILDIAFWKGCLIAIKRFRGKKRSA